MSHMKGTSALHHVERFLNHVVGSILILGMMLLVVCDVGGRYFFNKPIHGTLEMTTFIMVGLVYFTLAYTQSIKAHIMIDIFLLRASRRARLLFELITCLLGMALFVLIAWQGVMSAEDAWKVKEVTDGLIPFPTFPSRLAIPIGSAVFVLRLLVDSLETFKKLTRKGLP